MAKLGAGVGRGTKARLWGETAAHGSGLTTARPLSARSSQAAASPCHTPLIPGLGAYVSGARNKSNLTTVAVPTMLCACGGWVGGANGTCQEPACLLGLCHAHQPRGRLPPTLEQPPSSGEFQARTGVGGGPVGFILNGS